MTRTSPKLSYKDLYPYQIRMIDHIRENAYCALWVDMGLGKTVSTLTAVKQMVEDFDSQNVLVVGPKRVVRKTWPDEIETWSHLNGLTTSKIIGSGAEQRLAGAKKRADIHLINTENLWWLVNHFVEQQTNGQWKRKAVWPWDTVIIDESSRFKNQDSNRYRAIRLMRKYILRMIQLTGTPAPKGLKDLWGQAYLLDLGQRLGSSFSDFQKRWYDPPTRLGAKWTIKPSAEGQIHNAMSDLALTLKAEDYLELPPVVDNWVRVSMTASELKHYRQFQRDLITEVKGETVNAANAGVLWGKLLQLANGAVYTEHPAWEGFHDRKLEALLDIEESLEGKPVMIVYNYRSDLARITEAFAKRGVSYRVLNDEQDEEDWNAGKFDRLLFHPASAGHGTNLHKNGCEEQIWFGLTPNTEYYLQARARIEGGHRRVGKNVRIHHIVCDESHDDLCRWILEGDIGEQDRLMEATKRIIRGEV